MQIADVYIASRTLDLAADNAAWRVADGPRRRRRPRRGGVLGLRTRRPARCAPATTCTAAWASTSPTRCTATSRGSPTSCTRSRRQAERRAVEDPTDQEPRAHRRAARAQGRAAGLLHRPRRRQRRTATWRLRPARRDLPAGRAADGRRRLDGRRLAEGVRRPRARRDRADDLRQRGAARRRAPAGGDAADRRPDADPLRHREAEGPVPRSGSSPATCTSRSATASPTPAPTWPRCAPPRSEDGDHYVVNGQKMWTTGGHQADYLWLAVRTDPDAPKHKGISILIVDTTDPGYSWTPIITADGSHHVNATYFNDVRVPVDMLVGEENQGWKLITTQLNHERVMLGPAGRIEGLRDRVADWATKAGVIDRPDVRQVMGEVTAVFRVNELLNWEVARAAAVGEISVGDASSSKVFAADQVQHLSADLVDIVHRYGDPVGQGDRRPDDLSGRAGQAQPGAHLRWRRAGGAARADRDVRARACRGCPDERHETDHGRGRADQGARRGVGVAGAVRGQPADDRHLARRDGLRQRALPHRRGAAVDGAGLDDARPRPAPPRRRPAEPDDGGPHRRGLHRRARHQLRADLRALPARRRTSSGSPPRSTRWSGPRTPRWARATS